MFKSVLVAGAGGFIGTCLRFLVERYCAVHCASLFPWSTFIVNVVGAFLIGIFFGLAEKAKVLSPGMNVFLITGFCGGFTTFSSFSDDMFNLLHGGHGDVFAVYLVATVVAGVLLVWLGRGIVRPRPVTGRTV